jgi:cysteinyl-tRNA synthetase
MLTFYNTLTRQKEEFVPIRSGQVGMYNCGPTVYDRVHIGNLRAYVFADTLRRVPEYNNYDVTQVINITDVGHLVTDADAGEDKMTKGLRREGLPLTLAGMKQLGARYTEEFIADLAALNIKHPTYLPKASDNIAEDIAIIETLSSKGYTYQTDDGVYFDTTKLSDYGKLAHLQSVEETTSRLTIGAESTKKNPRDFALWKFDQHLGWKSPFGQGFPGWHIECSGMSMKYLGETFDIHTGGIDHIPVHHTNEIAQSEAANDKPLAHYWLHVNFLNIDDTKISKSLGNTLTLQELVEHGIDSVLITVLNFPFRGQLSVLPNKL